MAGSGGWEVFDGCVCVCPYAEGMVANCCKLLLLQKSKVLAIFPKDFKANFLHFFCNFLHFFAILHAGGTSPLC